MRVHLAREHALELQPLHRRGQRSHVGFDLGGGVQVGFGGNQLQQFRGIPQAARQAVETVDHLLQSGALPAQFLRALRLVPDAGLFQLAGYFLQAFAFVVVIKDTSSRTRCAPRDLR